jgi:hypothetical protein
VASVTGGVVAGIAIGFYEVLAFRAGWWKYEPARAMIAPACPAYIPLGEGLMFLAILPVFRAMLRGPDPRRSGPVVWGAVFGAIILVSYLAAWLLLEKTGTG